MQSRILVLLVLLFGWESETVSAQELRSLPEGQLPDDQRLGDLKTLDGYFPFSPPGSRDEWDLRSERLRRQLQVATGLWPPPTKTPSRAVVHGRVDRETYTVEKVYLESYPGHFVTGSLYRPKGWAGRRPGVLSPHGHWENGRFFATDEEDLREQIKEGGEKFEVGGRYPLQARCVQLARMGCIVFHYDMVGYADSQQLAHRPGIREEMNTPEDWGFFSPQAEARLQSMMGLQTYNSIRALDWFSELPDVDPDRIAVTGASGGGTQTFILCSLDPRPAVAFPAVMVSTAMQGGCTCENASYLRIGTGNVEIAALIAPRPLGMTAADDWTSEIESKGLPELKQHYRMFQSEDLVRAAPFLQFGHNYNYVSRNVMYHWLSKHLQLEEKGPIVETDFKPLAVEEMQVWDELHPRPASGDSYERSLLKWMTEDSEKQIGALVPNDSRGLSRYREIVGGAIDIMIGRRLPSGNSITAVHETVIDRGAYRVVTCLLRYSTKGEEVPVVRLIPRATGNRSVVWLDSRGKQSLFDEQSEPRPAIARLLASGIEVVGIDLFGQGEFTADGEPLQRVRMTTRGTRPWQKYAAYTFGYNFSVFSRRVHDVLSLVAFLKEDRGDKVKVDVVGLAGAGHWAAAARAQAGKVIDRMAIDTDGFRFSNLTEFEDPDFLPGGAKYGDLPGIIALSAPLPVWLSGEGAARPAPISAVYQAAGSPENLTVYEGGEAELEQSAVAWLLH